MRRFIGNMSGARYCANTSTKEVHDLENEKINCRINDIIRAGHDKPFHVLVEAYIEGYDRCKWCNGGSKK